MKCKGTDAWKNFIFLPRRSVLVKDAAKLHAQDFLREVFVSNLSLRERDRKRKDINSDSSGFILFS